MAGEAAEAQARLARHLHVRNDYFERLSRIPKKPGSPPPCQEVDSHATFFQMQRHRNELQLEARADTGDQLMMKIAEHANGVHNISSVPADLKSKIEATIKTT